MLEIINTNALFIMIVYAKYTKLISISRPTVVKYSDLITSRVEKSIQKFGKIFEAYGFELEAYEIILFMDSNKDFVCTLLWTVFIIINTVQRSLQTKSLFEYIFPRTILDNIFFVFIVSQQLLNVFIFLEE